MESVHNYASISSEGDRIIHRKGATNAESYVMGVVPGNMRDGTFIVRGKGNEKSLCSCSHGAGRIMGRKEAKKILDVDLFVEEMSKARIVSGASFDKLDESPFAYKDIFAVMEEQKDLVEVVERIYPMINVKG